MAEAVSGALHRSAAGARGFPPATRRPPRPPKKEAAQARPWKAVALSTATVGTSVLLVGALPASGRIGLGGSVHRRTRIGAGIRIGGDLAGTDVEAAVMAVLATVLHGGLVKGRVRGEFGHGGSQRILRPA